MATPRELSPIPEVSLEFDDCTQSEISADRGTCSPEDEGYASETQRLGVDRMLDGLAEMSRRLSLAPSVISIDEALHLPSPLNTGCPPPSRFDREDIAGGLESFWATVRQEVSKLRKDCNQAQADSAILAEEVFTNARMVEERNATIARLKSELSSERKAGKQLQEAMEDLLAWVDANRLIKPSEPSTSPAPVTSTSASERRVYYLLERVDNIPTYGVAFRKRATNEVLVWSVQVVEGYDSKGYPVYYHGSQLPRTMKSYIKFLQFWSSDHLPISSGSILCLWCIERGFKSSWHKGFEGTRPCRECSARGRHCFSIVSGVVRCLPIKNISGFLRGGT